MNLMLLLFSYYIKMNVYNSANLFSKSHLYKKSINLIKNNGEYDDFKFCKNCIYFLPNTFILPNYEFGKCALYSKIKYDENFLVTGKKKCDTIEYSYCSIVRRNEKECGQEGKDFISKYNK